MPPYLNKLELSALYDLLAAYTAKYTQILRQGPSDNLKNCQNSILALQTEIDFRKTEIDTGVQQYKDLDEGLELAMPLA